MQRTDNKTAKIARPGWHSIRFCQHLSQHPTPPSSVFRGDKVQRDPWTFGEIAEMEAASRRHAEQRGLQVTVCPRRGYWLCVSQLTTSQKRAYAALLDTY